MKKVLTIISIIFFLTPELSFAQLDLFDEAYAFYPLGNDCYDYSGNDFHLNCTNTQSAEGYYLNQDGSSEFNGIDSKIVRPHLSLDDTITIAGWFYSTSNFQNCNLFYNGNSASNGYGIFLKKPFTTYGLGRKIVVVQGGISENILDTAYNMPLNEWTHVALVIRGTSFELYINGALSGSGVRPFFPPDGEFSIGMNSGQQAGGFPSFFGKADDVVVYRKNVNSQWIYRLYTVGFVTHNKDLTTLDQIKISKGDGVNSIFINSASNIIRLKATDLLGRDVKLFPVSGEKNKYSVPNGLGLVFITCETNTGSFGKMVKF